MDGKALAILGACQVVMDRGIQIVAGSWSVDGTRNQGTYRHYNLKLCPLSALLIVRNTPCVHGAIYDAADELNTSVGWVVGFCRGFDEERESHPTDSQWFKAVICCPLDLSQGRRAGVRLRRIIDRAANSTQSIQDVLENDRKVHEHSRAATRRMA